MIKVLATTSKERMYRYGIKPPENFEIVHLVGEYTDEEFIEKSKGATFIFLGLTRLNKNIIDNLGDIKLIQTMGVGYDGVDIEAAKEKGIPISNNRGVNKDSVAEHTIGLMLSSLRRIPQADRDIKNFKFKESYDEYREKGTRSLKNYHVGIIGLGDIGIEVIKRLQPFGCKISYYSNTRKQDMEEEYDIDYLELDELLKTCDVITIHTPLNKATEGMINKEKLEIMKENAILINTARGEIIEQYDLANALEAGQIEMAALDTISPEPPTKNHPLLNLTEKASNKLILTTHIAGVTTDDVKRMQQGVWDNMERVLRGEKALHILNDK